MNNVVVVDASIAIKWVLNETDSPVALALLNNWIDKEIEIHAPALLAYEVTNTFFRRVRKGMIPFDDARRGLTEIIFNVIEFEFPADPDISIRAMELGQKFGLPAAYDSHYLALAENKECELWTADTRLWRAVKDQLDWVHLIEDYPSP